MEFDIESIIDNLSESQLTLFLVPSADLGDLNQDMVKYFTTEEDALVVYVTVAKPSTTMRNSFEKAGAKTGNIFFIDCATGLTGAKTMKRAKNTVFVEPQQLTNISISITQAVKSLPEDREKLLIFDSMSTLMIYNSESMVSKFAHSLTAKIRKWNIKSIIFTLEEETDDKIKSQLTQFCDNTIEL